MRGCVKNRLYFLESMVNLLGKKRPRRKQKMRKLIENDEKSGKRKKKRRQQLKMNLESVKYLKKKRSRLKRRKEERKR